MITIIQCQIFITQADKMIIKVKKNLCTFDEEVCHSYRFYPNESPLIDKLHPSPQMISMSGKSIEVTQIKEDRDWYIQKDAFDEVRMWYWHKNWLELGNKQLEFNF